MKMRSMAAAALCGLIRSTVYAQQPAADLTYHVQLVLSDTTFTTRDSTIDNRGKMAGYAVQCVPPEPGQPRRLNPACGPSLKNAGIRLLADQRMTADARGHVMQRMAWSGGEAAVEIDARDVTPSPSGDYFYLKVSFWPQLKVGETPPATAAMTGVMPKFPLSRVLRLMVLNKTSAMTLLVEAEPRPGAPGR